MPLRPSLLQNIGGDLTFSVTESGTIASAHADLFDLNGAPLLSNVTPTISDSTLTISIDGALVDELGDNWRVLWTYVISGKTYRKNQTFDVVMNQIYPTLTTTEQLYLRYPLLEGRDFVGTVGKQQTLIQRAWEDLLNWIRGYGKNPNRMIDPSPLEPAHAALAAAYIARSYRPGSSQSTDWQQWAAARSEEAATLLRQVMNNFPWYDLTEDLVPTIDEEHIALQTVRMTR